MRENFRKIAYTDSVHNAQLEFASPEAHFHRDGEGLQKPSLGPAEMAFIAAADSFYIASVNTDDWPYIQHRGGPPGFVKIITENQLAFPDFRGNRQYISTGNISANPRVCLFFMDYAHQQRLKLFAFANWLKLDEAGELANIVALPNYRARIERVVTLDVVAFDWNCPQHISPR